MLAEVAKFDQSGETEDQDAVRHHRCLEASLQSLVILFKSSDDQPDLLEGHLHITKDLSEVDHKLPTLDQLKAAGDICSIKFDNGKHHESQELSINECQY